jgi:diguanylate cyclase (GGDEF)-like protein/PAS domain S-box-containing protein
VNSGAKTADAPGAGLAEPHDRGVQDADGAQRRLPLDPLPALRAVFDGLPVMVCCIAFEEPASLLYWNGECERCSGYSAAEVVGRPEALQLLYPEPLYLARKLAQALARGPHFRGVEWTLMTKDGQRRRISWSSIDSLVAVPGRQWCLGVDVTVQSESHRQLRDRDKLLSSVFRHLPDMVYLKDGEGRWLLANPSARAMRGARTQNGDRTALHESLEADQRVDIDIDADLSALTVEATWQSGKISQVQETVDDGHGNLRYYDVTRVPSYGRRGQRLHQLVVRRDVTDQRNAATKLELAARVLEQSTDGIILTDADNHIVMVNAAFTEITGYQSDEVLGRDPRMLASGQHDQLFFAQMWKLLGEQGRWSGEIWNRRKNGEVYPQWLNLTALRQRSTDELTHYVAAFSDLSSRKAAEQKIAHLSSKDAVTGLANRTQATVQARLALKHAEAGGERVALVVVDVDHFKHLNDSLGHSVGDQLLREMGARLQALEREPSVVGRLSGDEFLVLLAGVQSTTEVAHAVRELMEVLGQPVQLGSVSVNVSVSAGIAMFPSDGADFETLFGRADAAMFAAKRKGRATYQFASALMNETAIDRLQIEGSLRAAIAQHALRLEYQPLVHLVSGRIVGAEALCRWDDPVRGAVPPSVFIPIAEDCGLIEALSGWVLMAATQQLRQWHDAGHTELMIAVNLSARQFQRGVVLQQVEAALVASGIAPERLELELTETVLLQDTEAVTATLRRLKALGVKLSMDDFGTGYSSLAYLRRFKFDKIKIDRSFVCDLIDDPDDAAIVRGIVSLAQSLGLSVLAEGVETEAIAQRLRHLQCTYAQGYLFDRPLRPEVFAARLGAP